VLAIAYVLDKERVLLTQYVADRSTAFQHGVWLFRYKARELVQVIYSGKAVQSFMFILR
jgi:hypothetical protein